jgi:hypothetical protein
MVKKANPEGIKGKQKRLKKKSIMPDVDFQVEILTDMISGRLDKSKCIRMSMNPESVLKREFDFFDLTPNAAKHLVEKLSKAMERLDSVREAYFKLDEIDGYLDGMQSTVANARDMLDDENWEDALDGIRNELEEDDNDLETAISEL